MEPREAHKYQKWCNDNGILIYPICTNSQDSYYIAVEREGKATKGDRIFENNPKPPAVNVWDQIRLLYKIIYEREFKTQTNEKQETKI